MSSDVRRVALIVLYDDDGLLLLQHRSDDAPTLPGFWGFFGGDVEAGEEPIEAVVREAQEEIEYTPRNPILAIDKVLVLLTGESIRAFVYTEKLLVAKSSLVLNEGQGMGWFKPPGHQALKMMPHDKEIVERISARIQREGPCSMQ